MSFNLVDFGSMRHVAGRLDTLAENARHTEWVMKLIYYDMMRAEEALFDSQGRRGGGSWKRLKPLTIKKKGSNRILETADAKENYSSIGNDALKKSLTRENAPFQVKLVDNTTILFGTSRPWASVHQTGSRRGVPPRPFLRFTKNDLNRWSRMMQAHLVKGFE